MLSNNINRLLGKTEGFIRSYYKNMMLKGSIITISLIFALFLIIDFSEYISWFNTSVRTEIFYLFIIITFIILVFFILIPFLKILKIGKTISKETAARLIGDKLKDVDDKLLNSLELFSKIENDDKYTDLLIASIEQKAKELSPIPFKQAIDKKKSYKNLIFFVPIFLIFLIIIFISPSLITGPTNRIINHSVVFKKPLPFTYKLLTDSLVCLQNSDFTVKFRFTGDDIPKNVFIIVDNNRFIMQQNNNGDFAYTFKTVSKNILFFLESKNFKSRKYLLKVYPKPLILNYEIYLIYPKYLGKKNEILKNTSEFFVPENTISKMTFYTEDVDSIFINSKNKNIDTLFLVGNTFSYKKLITNNFNAIIIAKNVFTIATDSLYLSIKSIKDEYPFINVTKEENINDEFAANLFFKGQIKDDYGFHDLKFFYKLNNSKKWKSVNIKIDKKTTNLTFEYNINISDLSIKSGQKLYYYFMVSDNDAIHNFKKSKTNVKTFEMPTDEKINKSIDTTSKKIKQEINNALNRLHDIQQKIEESKLDMLNKKHLNWMDRERLKNLLNEEMQLQEQFENIKKLEEKIDKLEKIKRNSIDEELKKQLKELEKLFKTLKNPELLKQLKKAKQEINKLTKNKLDKILDDIKKNNKLQKSDIERNDELYKQLEFEKKFSETLKKLDTLSKQQIEESLKNSEKSQKNAKSLINQDKINKKFKNVLKQLKTTFELNKKLEDPLNIKQDKELENAINNDMEQASSYLEKKRQKKASRNQQNAGNNLKKMKDKLEMAFNNEMSSRMGEDAQNMKRLLDNLIQLSFDQESSMKKINSTSKNDPLFINNINNLQQIRENYKIINDSLDALSKRNIFVKPFILKESASIKNSLNRAINSIQDRYISKSLTQQQYAMTSMNNLALLMEESLERMQQSMMNMKSSGKGKSSCSNPGSGKGGTLNELLQKQKQLSKSLNKMKGKNKGKINGGSSGENGDSEKLAKMAALQQQIREMLQQYMEQLKSENGNGNAMNEILKEMLQNEKDMVNKNITSESLKRQKDIEVRLLKAKNAKLERDLKKQRESKEGENIKRSNLNLKLQYKKLYNKNKDIIITKPIRLNPFYRNLHNNYINKLEKENGSNN